MSSKNSTKNELQLLHYDWLTQYEMLKIAYKTEYIKVKYLDEENEEVCINNQADYDYALQNAIEQPSHYLKLILKDLNGEIIGKPEFLVTKEMIPLKKKIKKNEPNQSSALNFFESDSKTNDQTGLLVNYLNQFKKEIISEMETKMKDLILSQSTILYTNNEEIPNKNNPIMLSESKNLKENVKKLLSMLSEAKTIERPIKKAYIQEEIELTGALNAVFVKDSNMPDGSHCLPNIKIQKAWLIKNTGILDWDEQFPVKLFCIGGNLNPINGVFSNVVTAKINEEVEVKVDLVTPLLAGEYFSEWVLVCNNFQFGPRLWCVIEVNDRMNNNESSEIFKQMVSDNFEDEFVVIPDCLNLEKKWTPPSKIHSAFDTELKRSLSESFNQEIRIEKKPSSNFNHNSFESNNELEQTSQYNKQQINLIPLFSSVKKENRTDEILVPEQTIQNENIKTEIPPKIETSQNKTESVSKFSLMKDAFANIGGPSYCADLNIIQTSTNNSNSNAVSNQTYALISPVSNVISSAISNIGSLGSIYQTGKQTTEESNMDKLISMGFANRKLNNNLLKKYNDNVEKVIQYLLDRQQSNVVE